MNYRTLLITLSLFLSIPLSSRLFAAGELSEGWMQIEKVTRLESGGIVFDSWEGNATVVSYDKSETCDEKEYECFTPTTKTIRFSIRKENAHVVQFLQNHLESGGFLVQFVIHRIEPVALSSSFEIVDVRERTAESDGIPERFRTHKTGSRHFSLYGEIIKLEYQGYTVGTYEGLYRDQKTGKVHPFSVTDREMAKHIYNVMRLSKPYYIGVSVAILTGFRKSDHDIFEINLNSPAGIGGD